jgi:exo-beta-1,3-glucanase (GH17 family)
MQDRKCPGDIVKTQLRTAVNAADDWVDLQLATGTASTYVSYMAANASAFWTAANSTQKSEVLVYCLEQRYGRLT